MENNEYPEFTNPFVLYNWSLDIPVISNEIYMYYTNIAQNMFNYLNGRVNKYYNAILIIDTYSINRDRYACLCMPNYVYLFLSEILSETCVMTEKGISGIDNIISNNIIKSFLINTITHELLHLEQQMDIYRYMNEFSYNTAKEYMVGAGTLQFIHNNLNEIESIFGFKYTDIEYLQNPIIRRNKQFMYNDNANVADLYKYLFMNLFQKNRDNFIELFDEFNSQITDKSIKNSEKNLKFVIKYVDPYYIDHSENIVSDIINKIPDEEKIYIIYRGHYVKENLNYIMYYINSNISQYASYDYCVGIEDDTLYILVVNQNPIISVL